MVVRVKLRVRPKRGGPAKELVVLANGGAESPRPCLVVDVSLAEELGLWPLVGAELYSVEEASGESSALLLPSSVELELLSDEGSVLSRVVADLAVLGGLREPLITDVTIDELGIVVLSFGRGLWRHVSDPPGVVRKSPMRSVPQEEGHQGR